MKKEEFEKSLNIEQDLPETPCNLFKLSPIAHPAMPEGYCLNCGFQIQYHPAMDLPERILEKEQIIAEFGEIEGARIVAEADMIREHCRRNKISGHSIDADGNCNMGCC